MLTARKLGCDDEKSIEVTALIRVNILSGCYNQKKKAINNKDTSARICNVPFFESQDF